MKYQKRVIIDELCEYKVDLLAKQNKIILNMYVA